ncbi:MAG: single-stranded DNA-binding protein [Firmicutes bacterium]|nr:single-stranded DNA-binding protein [Bacillota bacterium]MCL2312365.1 single-stranded DNA-binding protein [Bacillota bacterium]
MATIIFTGRLTSDVKTANGWTNFTVAENKSFKSKGEETTNFFNCKAQLSEAQVKCLKKGSKVEIVGNFDFETYGTENGKHYTHSVFVYNLNFVPEFKKSSTN